MVPPSDEAVHHVPTVEGLGRRQAVGERQRQRRIVGPGPRCQTGLARGSVPSSRHGFMVRSADPSNRSGQYCQSQTRVSVSEPLVRRPRGRVGGAVAVVALVVHGPAGPHGGAGAPAEFALRTCALGRHSWLPPHRRPVAAAHFPSLCGPPERMWTDAACLRPPPRRDPAHDPARDRLDRHPRYPSRDGTARAYVRPPGADLGGSQRRLPPGLPRPAVPVPQHRPRTHRPSHRLLRPRRAGRRAHHLPDPPVSTRPARRRGGHRHHQSRDLGPPPHVHARRPLGLARHRVRLPRPAPRESPPPGFLRAPRIPRRPRPPPRPVAGHPRSGLLLRLAQE